jgi:hypothetical protein
MADKLDGGAIVANTIPGTKIQSGTITTTQLDPAIAAAVTVPLHPKISSITYPGNDTAANTGGGDSIVINGSGFGTNVQVYINGTAAPSVTRNNANAVTITTAAQSAGTYLVYLINTDDGGTAILVPGIQYSGMPTWVTTSPLTGQEAAVAWSISLSATGDSPITYALQAGSSLPAGITLAANGLISGTMTSPPESDTTYNFTVLATDPQSQDTPKAFSVSVTVVVDPQFQYTTLLLQADGTNNGNNHAFLDSSNNNFTITRNGNATQGSFTPFSPTGWSNYFDGTGDYLTWSGSTLSGDFTVECWVFKTAVDASGYTNVFSGSNGNHQLFIDATTAGSIGLVIGASTIIAGSGVAVTPNMWHHLAWVREGSTCRVYVDGIQQGTGSSSTSFALGVIGRYYEGGYEMNGYISNARIVAGTCLYPSGTTFTPPTSPLTAVSNTALLTCQSNRFRDASTNNFAITRNGDVSVQTFSPFATTTAYSPATHGGSAFFDGSGDYLETTSSQIIPSGNFTIEAWAYITNSSSTQTIVAQGTGVGDGARTWMGIENSSGAKWAVQVGGTQAISSVTPVLNAWHYLAMVYSGSTIKMYLNGTEIASASSTTNASNTTLKIGTNWGGYITTGFLSNIRISNTARTISAVPSSLLAADANTVFLANFTNAQIYDAAAGAVLECIGDAKVNTAIKKYGAGSITFDGNGDYLITNAPSTETTNLGSGDFTVELWVYFNGVSSVQTFVDWRDASTVAAYPLLVLNSDATILWSHSNNTRITSSPISANTWYHVAVCRAGGQTKLFINGTQSGSTYSDSTTYLTTSGAPRIGIDRRAAPSYYFNGYIDDLRISKGLARYRYPFTPPTRAFPTKGGTAPAATADEYFDYTTLLLPGNGTNNQNNHTFLDSSNNNFTITRNGNATQGTFSPFSQTGWSNYFDGSGDRLTGASPIPGLSFGTGDFTTEYWVYKTNSGVNAVVFDARSSASASPWVLAIDTNNCPYFYDGSTYTSSLPIQINFWNHVATVRTSSTLKIFVNGVQGYSASYSTNLDRTAGFVIGDTVHAAAPLSGYLSNLRIIKGTAIYTSEFTPSTSPLTAISNTSLLTCQSSRFIDNSANNLTITRAGDVSVQAFSPFAPTASYAAANVGGSGYFDGSGDRLSLSGNSAFDISSGDFTIEGWIYPQSNAATQGLFVLFTATNSNYAGMTCYVSRNTNSTITVEGASPSIGGGSPAISITTTATALPNTWTHIAVTRSGSTFTCWLNGVSAGTATFAGTLYWSPPNLYVGSGNDSATNYFTGYISNVRIAKGTAVYTTTFTPPTAPLTAISNTSFLLNFTNAGITDATAKTIFETVGDAKISTAQSKFGGSSMYFDGTGDLLLAKNNNNFDFGTGDFTVEFWINASASGTYNQVVGTQNSNADNGAWRVGNRFNSANVLYFARGNGSSFDEFTAAVNVNDGSWHHVAVARASGSVRIFVDGVFANSSTISGTCTSGNDLRIGFNPRDSSYVTGYVDDLRITKGIARYTQNFALPTTAHLTR